MAGWHHGLDGGESESTSTPGVGDGQGGLVEIAMLSLYTFLGTFYMMLLVTHGLVFYIPPWYKVFFFFINFKLNKNFK